LLIVKDQLIAFFAIACVCPKTFSLCIGPIIRFFSSKIHLELELDSSTEVWLRLILDKRLQNFDQNAYHVFLAIQRWKSSGLREYLMDKVIIVLISFILEDT
jgi:hypothetical protein